MIQTKVLTFGPDSTISVTGPENAVAVRGITIYGKSTQNGTPTPSNPVSIVSIASGGTLTLTAVYDDDTGTWGVTVANGLKGIPLKEPSGYKYLTTQDGKYLATQDGKKLMAK